MAVVQISRIQIRRGQKNQGTGLPQLASGEMAWAIDSQELFIGNGAISEGAPALGNTKIITQKDNLLDIANQYRYKKNNPLVLAPVVRNLSERLDDHVSNLAYGILPNGNDMTSELQYAIDSLWISNRAEKVTLEFLPGTFKISSTIYIPSYVSIRGSGKGKTIFEYLGNNGPVFKFIDDRATTINRNVNIDNFLHQPKHIELKGFTIKVNESDTACFLLNSVRDSNFEDIEVIGNFDWFTGQDSTIPIVDQNYAFNLESYSEAVSSKNNHFKKIKISRYVYPFVSKHDIINNVWDDCEIIESKFGFLFGQGTDTFQLGQRFGPRRNIIKNSFFTDVKENGVLIVKGYGNQTNNNVFVNVGNNGAGNMVTGDGSSIIKFVSPGNLSWGDIFDRAYNSEFDGVEINTGLAAANFNRRYYPEVSGSTNFLNQASTHLTIPVAFNSMLFRIPFDENCTIIVTYLLTIFPLDQSRSGKLIISVDNNLDKIIMTEEYDYMGNPLYESNVVFSVELGTGVVNIYCKHVNGAYPADFSYTYQILSSS